MNISHNHHRRPPLALALAGVLALWLAACTPTPTPAAESPVTPTLPAATADTAVTPSASVEPVLVPTATPVATPAAAQSGRPVDVPLSADWIAAAADVGSSARAYTRATDDALLTAVAVPRHGLTLADYVAGVQQELQRAGAQVARAGVIYTLHPSGVPVGVVEYQHAGADPAAAVQWSMLNVEEDEIIVVTLAAHPDNFATPRADVETALATLHTPYR